MKLKEISSWQMIALKKVDEARYCRYEKKIFNETVENAGQFAKKHQNLIIIPKD